MSEQKDYTVDDVATMLQCHRRLVERLIASGELKAYHIGRYIRISPDKLEEYKANHPVQTRPARVRKQKTGDEIKVEDQNKKVA